VLAFCWDEFGEVVLESRSDRRCRLIVGACSTKISMYLDVFVEVWLVSGVFGEGGIVSELVRRVRLNVVSCSTMLG